MTTQFMTVPIENIVFRKDYLDDDFEWYLDRLKDHIRVAIDDFKIEHPLCRNITATLRVCRRTYDPYDGDDHYLGIRVRGEQDDELTNPLCPHGIEKTPLTECAFCGDKNWPK